MENDEFTLKALKRLIPDTSWWGETNHDTESVKNLDLLSDMLDMMIDSLAEYSYVPKGNKGNFSYEEIARKKRKIIENLKAYFDEYFEEFGGN